MRQRLVPNTWMVPYVISIFCLSFFHLFLFLFCPIKGFHSFCVGLGNKLPSEEYVCGKCARPPRRPNKKKKAKEKEKEMKSKWTPMDIDDDLACEICKKTGDESLLLLCEGCNKGIFISFSFILFPTVFNYCRFSYLLRGIETSSESRLHLSKSTMFLSCFPFPFKEGNRQLQTAKNE